MTEFQKQQIRDLRLQGAGYRAIATIVGVSRDHVRNFCRANSMDGYAAEIWVNMRKRILDGVACLACGKELQQAGRGRRRRFCSVTCRRNWWAAHPGNINKKLTAFYPCQCAHCGKAFQSYGNKNRKYCSHECYVRDRFYWEEEGRVPYKGPSKKEEIHDGMENTAGGCSASGSV